MASIAIIDYPAALERARITKWLIGDATALIDPIVAIVAEYRWIDAHGIHLWHSHDIGHVPKYLHDVVCGGLADHATAIFATMDRAYQWPDIAHTICGDDEAKLGTLYTAMRIFVSDNNHAPRGHLPGDDYAAFLIFVYVTMRRHTTQPQDFHMRRFLRDTTAWYRPFGMLCVQHGVSRTTAKRKSDLICGGDYIAAAKLGMLCAPVDEDRYMSYKEFKAAYDAEP